MKNDKYRKDRGGYSRILQLSCASCGHNLFRYQKDGPGILKRLYVDLIQDSAPAASKLICPKGKEVPGVKTIYKKESRPAYKLFVGNVAKKIVKQ